MVAGDAIAGEASTGTLRYLLAVPVGRTRLLGVKFAADRGVVGGVRARASPSSGVLAGLVLFPSGELTLLSGRTVSYADGLVRLLAVAAYVALGAVTVGAIGLFVSTMTEVPIAAMAATLTLTIVSEVADAVPQLSADPRVAAQPLLAAVGRPAARPDRHRRHPHRPARGAGLRRVLPLAGVGPLRRQGRHVLTQASYCR